MKGNDKVAEKNIDADHGGHRRRREASSEPLHRRGRQRELQQGARTRCSTKQLEAGRHALGPADAAHPRARLRLDRRRRRAAPARAHRGARDDRAPRRSRAACIPMDQSVSEVVLLIGLAVGVDYALFYLKREREERAAGRGHRAALEAAAATSGRSVLISGLTVMVAMAGMFFSGDQTFRSFGDRHDDGRRDRDARLAHRAPGAAVEARRPRREGPDPVPRPAAPPARREPRLVEGPDPGAPPSGDRGSRVGRSAARDGGRRCSTCTPRSPVSPACRATLRRSRRSTASRRRSSGTASPRSIAVTTPTHRQLPSSRTRYNAFRGKALATGADARPGQASTSTRRTRSRGSRSRSPGSGVDATSNAALATLRNDVLPATIGTLPGRDYAVTGRHGGIVRLRTRR